MKFEPSAFLVGTQGFTASERGIYIALLCHQWERGGYLPADHGRLARIAGVTQEEFDSSWSVIGEKFQEDDEGYYNPRALSTFNEAVDLIERRSEAGKKGAQVRHSSSNRIAKAEQTHCDGIADAMPRASSSLSSSGSSSRQRGVAYPQEFDVVWLAYPRRQKKADALRAWKQTAPDRPATGELVEKIEGLKRTRAWTEEAGRFVPLLATWLRSHGWLDEQPDEPQSRPKAPEPPPTAAKVVLEEFEHLTANDVRELIGRIDGGESTAKVILEARRRDYWQNPDNGESRTAGIGGSA